MLLSETISLCVHKTIESRLPGYNNQSLIKRSWFLQETNCLWTNWYNRRFSTLDQTVIQVKREYLNNLLVENKILELDLSWQKKRIAWPAWEHRKVMVPLGLESDNNISENKPFVSEAVGVLRKEQVAVLWKHNMFVTILPEIRLKSLLKLELKYSVDSYLYYMKWHSRHHK